MKGFKRYSLSDLLTLERRPVQIDSAALYTEIGIYSFGRGIFHKQPRSGLEVGNKDLFLIKNGDFILQITFAWEGAVGLASAQEDGLYGSIRYPTFRVDEDKCFPPYLLNYFRTHEGREQLIKISPGSAGRNRVLSLKRITEVSVPLPPLEEQQRIVARIEELVAKTEKAQGLHRKAIEASERLLLSTVATLLKPDQWVKFTLGSLLRESSLNGLSTRPSDIAAGIPILRISAATSRQDFLIDEEDHKYIELNEQDYLKYKAEPDDILVCRFNGNLHFVGRFALYKKYSGKTHVFPDKLIRLRVDTEKILPEFLCITANSSIGRQYIEAFCATTAGNIGISAGNLKTIPIPVPSLKEQKYIVECFHDLQSKVDILKRKQAKTSVELDAMLPSILDKAFKGDL